MGPPWFECGSLVPMDTRMRPEQRQDLCAGEGLFGKSRTGDARKPYENENVAMGRCTLRVLRLLNAVKRPDGVMVSRAWLAKNLSDGVSTTCPHPFRWR